MAVLILVDCVFIYILAYTSEVGFHLRMLNLSLYLCRTQFETVTEFEIEVFYKYQPRTTFYSKTLDI